MFSFHTWFVVYLAGKIAVASGPMNAVGCFAMKDSVQQQVEQTFADQTAPHLFGWYVVKKSQIELKCMVFRTPPQVAKTLPLQKVGQQ
jgi:CRISPR/Cas system endoribonuclease Cas6 (RAMP superfamily)